jgi:hypothetical protein
MERSDMLGRMLRAAESWGQRLAGQPVAVRSYSEPCCGENGAYSSEITLEARDDGGSQPPAAIRCLVTLEPDGALGCVLHDRTGA